MIISQRKTSRNEMNELIYESINNGVYKSGFALTQKAYENAVIKLFEVLELDKVLSESKYLVVNIITEADLRLIHFLGLIVFMLQLNVILNGLLIIKTYVI